MKLIQALLLTSCLSLAACGSQNSRVYKKQRSESDIKISHFDLKTGIIKTRFQYQSYEDKSLEQISCEGSMNSSVQFKLEKSPNIQLAAFSKEIIEFQAQELSNHQELKKSPSINYNISCQITYDRGGEHLKENSKLYLSPSSENIYR